MKKIFVLGIFSLLSTVLLSCGQSGNLYFPEEEEKTKEVSE